MLNAIKIQVKVAVDYEKLLNLLKNSVGEKSIREKQNALISSLRLRINGIRKKNKQLYLEFTENILSQQEYLYAKESFQEELTILEQSLTDLLEQKEQFNEAMSTNNKWITLMKSVSKARKLNQPLVDTAIEKVLVYQDERIELVMKYQDVFLKMTSCVEKVENEVVS